ncbi:hypothetical protein FGG08_001531 [Glutinoglossum americanum]|uniref:Rhodanese domain-containing protein n=1 Tax=Glutinoglossum americanum TaxID=1670608 RepID=A0A9P8IGM2_9PEZI|nr:hypothetical protein FGG08_001531 [Glutinoglossum americanum]
MTEPTISNLPRITPQTLSGLLLSQPAPKDIAVIDVRTTDHVGGHIRDSMHVPSDTLDHRIPALVRELEGKKTVVFHCTMSQHRGPGAALQYWRERRRMLGEAGGQEVVVLEGGFMRWQEKYGKDERLTEAYAEDIWADGYDG